MVVINIHGSNSNSKRHIDFTDILPDFPAEGILVAKTLALEEEEENENNHPIEWDYTSFLTDKKISIQLSKLSILFWILFSSSVIHMGHVELEPFEGFVIALDFGTQNYEEEE